MVMGFWKSRKVELCQDVTKSLGYLSLCPQPSVPGP